MRFAERQRRRSRPEMMGLTDYFRAFDFRRWPDLSLLGASHPVAQTGKWPRRIRGRRMASL